MRLKVPLKTERPVEVLPGTGYCPKVKGGRRYAYEVLQIMCPHCTVIRKYRCNTPKEMRALLKEIRKAKENHNGREDDPVVAGRC